MVIPKSDSAQQIRELRLLSEQLGFDLAHFISSFSNFGYPFLVERKIDGTIRTNDGGSIFHLNYPVLALLAALRTSKGKSGGIDGCGDVAHG
jgi:hypothetical protein